MFLSRVEEVCESKIGVTLEEGTLSLPGGNHLPRPYIALWPWRWSLSKVWNIQLYTTKVTYRVSFRRSSLTDFFMRLQSVHAVVAQHGPFARY